MRIFGKGLLESSLGPLMGIILSRAISGMDCHGNIIPLGLAPILDFCNHSEEPNARHSLSVSEESVKESNKGTSLILSCRRYIQAGEEVCISYGEDRNSASFLSLYSFLPAPLQTSWKGDANEEEMGVKLTPEGREMGVKLIPGRGIEGEGEPLRLLNSYDLLDLVMPMGVDREPLAIRVPQALIYDSEIRLKAAFTTTTTTTTSSSGNGSGDSNSKEEEKRREAIKAFEDLVKLLHPPSLALLEQGLVREVSRLDALLAAQERPASSGGGGSEGGVEPAFLAQCNGREGDDSERRLLLLCKTALDTEYYATAALLECCRLYSKHGENIGK